MPDEMTVGYFLRYWEAFYPKWDRALALEMARQFDLPLDRRLRHLSRGMRMKAALASSLAYRPELIVLDEPFSGLDALVRQELVQGLLDRAEDTTILISSHDLAEIESFASHVGYLEQGSLVFSEEMTTLSNRFRRVEFQVDPAATIPQKLPTTWLGVERAGSLIRFTHSSFRTDSETVAQVESLFPTADNVEFLPLSLRSIFLANARSQGALRATSNSGAHA
jgi:ABC-2 type transport system ATP-binding protein